MEAVHILSRLDPTVLARLSHWPNPVGDRPHSNTAHAYPSFHLGLAGGSTMARGPKTILVVDDVDLVRRIANRMLSREGYRVLEAADADEALGLLSKRGVNVDLVLLDVILPNRDGVALYADICVRWPRIPVVFMSAHPAEILATSGQKDLTVPFLAKPFTSLQITSKIHDAISKGVSQRSTRTSGPQFLKG
jgi:DNA-binding NtrC family response regulator